MRALAALGLVLFAAAPARPVQAPEPGYREDYVAFAELLTRFRQGEDPVLEELRLAGARFAERHGRDDAPRVVDYYARLTAAERAQGWRGFETFSGLWRRVEAAETESWPQERDRLLAELRAFVDATVTLPDYVPAGRALSLCARIELERLANRAPEDADSRAARIERAWRDAERALELFERAGQRTPRLEPLWVLGKLELEDERPREAEPWLEECAVLSQKVRSDTWREKALIGLVHVARAAGDLVRIDELLLELASFRDARTCWPLAREHAARLLDEDAARAAVEFLEGARPESARDLEEWRRRLAIARLRAGDLEGARRELAPLADEDAGPELRAARWTLALAEDRPEAVLAALGDGAALAELTGYERLYALPLAGEALLREGRAEEARAVLREALALADSIEAGIDAGGTASVFGERMGLHAVQLAARAELAAGRPIEAALVVERSQSRAFGTAEVDAQDLLAWAARFELGLVTFVCGADAGVALHVARDGRVEARELPHGRRALFEGARRLREALVAQDEARAAALGAELARELLPEGLLARLADGAGGRLAVLAHGPIERLPVEQLVVAGARLEERCTPLVLPGLPARRPPVEPLELSRAGWWLLGDPRDASGSSRLAGAARELRELAALHPDAARSVGSEFSPSAARAAIASGRALHVATHLVRDARCADERLAALGLELDRGAVLCAGEVRALAAASPLVVLAACETGEGRFLDAEGLLGLARAFLEAGTRNLVVTLWPVGDAAARDFALALHRALLAGAAPSEAARRARAELRALGHGPADAAAFRLVGCD